MSFNENCMKVCSCESCISLLPLLVLLCVCVCLLRVSLSLLHHLHQLVE